MEEETKKASKARRGEDDKFTSLEKLGGGRGRINLAAGPVIPLEGKAPGLRGAGDLGAGFGASWQFKAARGDWMKAREMKPEIAAQGPPALNFNDNLNRKLERMGGAALDAQIRGMSPFGGGIQGNLAEKLLERLLRVTEDALAIQSRTLDAPVV
jgi:hypothetical protein